MLKGEIIKIEAEYDDNEKFLIEQIRLIGESYKRQIKPLEDKLVKSRMNKTPKYFITRKDEQQQGE